MSKKEYEELSRADWKALHECGVFCPSVVEVRRDPEGNQERLIEGRKCGWDLDGDGWWRRQTVRGWWKHGQSAADIKWEVC